MMTLNLWPTRVRIRLRPWRRTADRRAAVVAMPSYWRPFSLIHRRPSVARLIHVHTAPQAAAPIAAPICVPARHEHVHVHVHRMLTHRVDGTVTRLFRVATAGAGTPSTAIVSQDRRSFTSTTVLSRRDRSFGGTTRQSTASVPATTDAAGRLRRGGHDLEPRQERTLLRQSVPSQAFSAADAAPPVTPRLATRQLRRPADLRVRERVASADEPIPSPRSTPVVQRLMRRALSTSGAEAIQEAERVLASRREAAAMVWRRGTAHGVAAADVDQSVARAPSGRASRPEAAFEPPRTSEAAPAPAIPPPPQAPKLDGPAIDRLAEDVMERIDRRLRIERERRGL